MSTDVVWPLNGRWSGEDGNPGMNAGEDVHRNEVEAKISVSECRALTHPTQVPYHGTKASPLTIKNVSIVSPLIVLK
jgi:hypothetical protein